MVKQTQTNQELENIINNYEDYTDKYFLRTKEILQQTGINPTVRYQVFARQNIDELKGVDEAAYFIKQIAGDKAKVYALRNSQQYQANTPLMKIEGKIQDIVDLETVYLGIIAGELTGEIDLEEVRKNARNIKLAAEDKPVYYFGARHFNPALDEKIARICYEQGFAGTSTDIGAKAWNAKGQGTIPHALILTFAAYMQENNIQGNPTVEATKAFDKYINQEVPRIALIDTFNREVNDAIATAKAVPNLAAVRIDTCGENYTQNSLINLPQLERRVPLKYIYGKGVKIAGVWGLREVLDKAGHPDVNQIVSSGFNEEKTNAFMIANEFYQETYGKPLFDAIGTGSFANPTMTTADIVAYQNEEQEWLPLAKKGRDEINAELEEVR